MSCLSPSYTVTSQLITTMQSPSGSSAEELTTSQSAASSTISNSRKKRQASTETQNILNATESYGDLSDNITTEALETSTSGITTGTSPGTTSAPDVTTTPTTTPIPTTTTTTPRVLEQGPAASVVVPAARFRKGGVLLGFSAYASKAGSVTFMVSSGNICTNLNQIIC